MLIILISLFSNYDLCSGANYEKAKFNESSLLKQHHENLLEVQNFIKDVQHRFPDKRPDLRAGDYEHESTKDEDIGHSITNWWWDNTSSIGDLGLNTQQTFLLPLNRSRPSFPVSITPYTTELNDRHLKWDDIFPGQSLYTKPIDSRLRINSTTSPPPINPSLPQPLSKTLMSYPKNNKPYGSTLQRSKLDFTRSLDPKTTLRPNTSVKGHSNQPLELNTASITLNQELKKIWLQEITTYTPVDKWVNSLSTKIGMTPNFDLTTKHASQVRHMLAKAQVSVPTKLLSNDSKNQPSLTLRQGISLPERPIKGKDYVYSIKSTATVTTAQFFLQGVGEPHFRPVAEKDEKRTKLIDEKPVYIPNDGKLVALGDAGDVLQREQEPVAPAPSSKKSRRFHSKVVERNRYLHSYEHKTRQRFPKHRFRYWEHSNEGIHQRQEGGVEYPMLRGTTENQKRFRVYTRKEHFKRMKKMTRPQENKERRKPTNSPKEMLQFSEIDDTGEERLMKIIEKQDDFRHKSKHKPSFYHQVKETLKHVESKKKTTRLKLKAELLRKIVEGSSYSDEEASLTKNLIQALKYGNKT